MEWLDISKNAGILVHTEVPRSSPGRTRNTQGMSGVSEEQTDTHTEGCIEEVAFFFFF